MNYVTDSCIQSGNTRINEEDLIDLLEEILDQEFDTICEDDSIKEISRVLIKYLEMLKNNQLDTIRSEISLLPPCSMWIVPGNRINIIKTDSDSSDDDDVDDEEDMNSMIVTENSSTPSTSGSTMQVMEEEENSEWTVVRKNKKHN